MLANLYVIYVFNKRTNFFTSSTKMSILILRILHFWKKPFNLELYMTDLFNFENIRKLSYALCSVIVYSCITI